MSLVTRCGRYLPRIDSHNRNISYIPHINNEQRLRTDAAEQLHIDLYHPSDQSLCSNLSTGKLPNSTTSEHLLNRQLRGPCPHCAAGKYRNSPHPASTSPPATFVGEVISMDSQLLPEPSPGQHTHEVILVDESTGHLSVVEATSKSAPAMLKALQLVISTTYNANQHRQLRENKRSRWTAWFTWH